ncbi:CDP-alcohol phosphatidyltransferase family protein [Candidatus Uhrbacteria bacterium]|nr:CDP-alcohol phosphatidyltransferase family protein [Candidatus Uhrbacteria bacterium]
MPYSIKPNHITAFRLLATPWVLALLLVGNYTWAIPAFLFTAMTDSLDGAMARVRGQITDWGKIWDPVADKILIGSVIYVFVLKYLDFYLGVFIIVIEIAFIVLGWIRLKRGYTVEANLMGKIKMVLQVVGVLILLVSVNVNWGNHLLPVSRATFYLAIVFAVLSLLTHGV